MLKFKLLIYSLCIFSIVLLQSTLFENFKIYGVKPNILLIFIILVAQIRGNGEGVLCGFLCGLAQDIVSGKIFGFYSLIGITLALFLEFINRRLYRKSMFISLIFVCLYTFIYEFTVYILTVFSKGSLQFGFIFNQVIVIEAAYNSIIAIFLYSLVTRIDTLFERRVSTSRNY